jgi:hypothetical protein
MGKVADKKITPTFSILRLSEENGRRISSNICSLYSAKLYPFGLQLSFLVQPTLLPTVYRPGQTATPRTKLSCALHSRCHSVFHLLGCKWFRYVNRDCESVDRGHGGGTLQKVGEGGMRRGCPYSIDWWS